MWMESESSRLIGQFGSCQSKRAWHLFREEPEKTTAGRSKGVGPLPPLEGDREWSRSSGKSTGVESGPSGPALASSHRRFGNLDWTRQPLGVSPCLCRRGRVDEAVSRLVVHIRDDSESWQLV